METAWRPVCWLCLLWALLLGGHSVVGVELVFQGTCGDASVPCEHLCVQQTASTFECGCWNDYELLTDGVSCKDAKSRVQINYDAPTVPPHGIDPDKQDGLSFNGSAYAAFDAPDSIYLETNITLEFKFDRAQDGLLLFAGQWDGKDFLAVSLIDGNIVLRFDCGEGTAEDVYSGPFTPNKWHTLSIMRKFCSHTQVSMNDVRRVLVDDIVELKHYRGISVDKYVYLGGAPDADKLLTRAVIVQGFVGCVRRLVINEVTMLDTPSGVNAVRESSAIAVCPGGRRPRPTSDDFTTTKSTPTTPTPPTTSKMVSGGLQTPSFAGESYLKYRAPEEFRDYVQVQLQFNPTEPDGLIYFEGQAQHEEYVIIYLKDAFVYMQFDLGRGAAQLRSERPVTLHSWHTLEAWRSGRGGILKTDAQPWVEITAPGGFARMAPGHAYLGGAPTDALPSSLQLHSGFHGCIREVALNAKRLEMILGAVSSVNVRECGADPCRPNPCQSGGQCAVYHDNYLCLCSHPNTGDHCEQIDSMLHQAIGLLGHGYLKFDQKEVMKHITGDRMDFSMTFKLRNTTQFRYDDEQMLAFAGETENRGDFFKLLVTNTHAVKLMINLGSGVVSLTHDQANLIDAEWHTVAVQRIGRKITVSVDDHLPLTTTAPAGSEQLNVYEALYIGGYPIEKGLFPGSGLRGCVSNIGLSPTFRIDSVQQAAQAMNVVSCERL